jgi:hypothetical protein
MPGTSSEAATARDIWAAPPDPTLQAARSTARSYPRQSASVIRSRCFNTCEYASSVNLTPAWPICRAMYTGSFPAGDPQGRVRAARPVRPDVAAKLDPGARRAAGSPVQSRVQIAGPGRLTGCPSRPCSSRTRSRRAACRPDEIHGKLVAKGGGRSTVRTPAKVLARTTVSVPRARFTCSRRSDDKLIDTKPGHGRRRQQRTIRLSDRLPDRGPGRDGFSGL